MWRNLLKSTDDELNNPCSTPQSCPAVRVFSDGYYPTYIPNFDVVVERTAKASECFPSLKNGLGPAQPKQ